MKIYISGPMTGLPDLNFPAFHAEAKRLRDFGYDVVNPAELNPNGGSWNECLRKDIAALVECDAIMMLPGWWGSKGALLERHIAEQLKMRFFDSTTPDHWLPGNPVEWFNVEVLLHCPETCKDPGGYCQCKAENQ